MRAFPFGSSLVILKAHGNSLVLLNSGARTIKESLDRGQQPESVASELAFESGISLEKAREDVASVIRFITSEADRPEPEVTGIRSLHSPARLSRSSLRTYQLAAFPFSICFESAEVESILESVLGHLQIFDAPTPDHSFEVLIEGGTHVLIRDGIEVDRDPSAHGIRHSLIYEITKISYPDSEWLIFIHAGAIASAGHCAVLPGLPRRGKSTLVAALMNKGFDYLAEDIVPLSRNLTVAPVRTRICLREGGWNALKKQTPEAESIDGGSRWGERLRYLTPSPLSTIANHPTVQCLIFPEYESDSAAEIAELSKEDMLAGILQTGAWFVTPPDETQIEQLLNWITNTPGYMIRYANLPDGISLVRSVLS